MEVRIDNFQSIKSGEIDVKGLTLVIGETSAGKSSVMRAITSATTNRFRSGSVRYGEKECKVTMADDFGTLVVSKKDGGSTSYMLNDTKYEKVGRDVPSDVDVALNLSNIEVGQDKFNLHIHPQFQKPLLMEFSQKRVMDILSASKGLDDLKYVQGELSTEKSRMNGSIATLDKMLENSLTTLNDLQSKYDNCKNLANDILMKVDTHTELNNTAKKLTSLLESYKSLSAITSKGKALRAIVDKSKTYNESKDKCHRLSSLHDCIVRCGVLDKKVGYIQRLRSLCDVYSTKSNRLTSEKTVLGSFKALKYAEGRITLLKQFDSVVGDYRALRGRIDKLSRLSDCLEKASDLENKVKQLARVVNGEVCPFCGKDMRDGHSTNHQPSAE